MNEDILINITPHETRVAIIQQGSVQEVWLERRQHQRCVGNMYWAKVERIMMGMQAAFLKINDEQSVFLHVSDLGEHINPHQLPLQKVLFEGQFLLLQISKDASQAKHARATTLITLSGRNLVYMPFSKRIGISHRIKENDLRDQLREKLQKIQQQDVRQMGGYIMRTVAHQASDEELELDVQYLQHTWTLIKENMRHQTSPTMVYQDLPLSFKACRDLVSEHTKSIYVDDAQTHQDLQAFTQKYIPYAHQALMHYQSSTQSLFSVYQVEKELAGVLKKRVDLKSGGYLLFDQTHALTTIDVNTGSFSGYKNFEESVYKTNVEAAKMLMRQLRLRNIAGMIIIDFIDMKSREHQLAILDHLQKLATFDRSRITLHGFTQLGLVEMTRKRAYESLQNVLCEPCKNCDGVGFKKSTQSICYEILHQLIAQVQQFNPKGFKIVAHDQVIDCFLHQESTALAAVRRQINKPIELQAQHFTLDDAYSIYFI